MSILCDLFGHKMYIDIQDASWPSICSRSNCGHKEPGIDLGLSAPPMPKIKKCNSCKNNYDGTNGNGYQPCGCNNA